MKWLPWLALVLFACVSWGCAGDFAGERPAHDAECLEEIDHIVGLAGVVLDPSVPAGEPLPVAVEVALSEHGLHGDDYETVFELNQHLILHSADGVASRPGSTEAIAELALLKGEDGNPNQWLVLYWRVRVPCEE